MPPRGDPLTVRGRVPSPLTADRVCYSLVLCLARTPKADGLECGQFKQETVSAGEHCAQGSTPAIAMGNLLTQIFGATLSCMMCDEGQMGCGPYVSQTGNVTGPTVTGMAPNYRACINVTGGPGVIWFNCHDCS